MTSDSDNVIDLSESFILADHRAISDIVIELDLSEDSIVELSSPDNSAAFTPSGQRTSNQSRKIKTKTDYNPFAHDNLRKTVLKNQESVRNSRGRLPKFGDCPICFDPFGQNPLASTKCGHVYCMKCIEQYIRVDKRCPTCRQDLKGKSPYHPLYLFS